MTYLLFFASGLLTALPFLFTVLWPVSWLSLIPIFALAPTVKKRYLHGFVFGMGFYLPLYYWFIKLYPMDFVGFTPLEGGITVLLCWFGLSALQASEMAFIPMVFGRLAGKGSKRDLILRPLLAASCFTAFEFLQSLGWHGVPWGRLALSQIDILPMVQSASLLGSMFICFLIALTNGIFAVLLPKALARWNSAPEAPRARTKARASAIFLALSALFVPLTNGIYGLIRLSAYEPAMNEAPTVKISLIQGNIASGDKWEEHSLATSMEKYLRLSLAAVEAESPDIVLWPETVVTTNLRTSRYYRQLSDFARVHEVTLVVGAYAYSDTEEAKATEEGEKPEKYNALYAFYPDGSCDETVYRKRHLVPFGEYLPVPQVFNSIPFLAGLNLSESALTPGTDSALFDTPYGMIGGLVCFDSIYDTLSRASTKDGAKLLLLSTNDSWYRDSHAIYQHNAHARLRAIENGRAIARAANTGISTLILPNGACTDATAPMVDATLSGTLPIMQTKTLYQTVGNLIAYLSLAFLASRALWLSIKHCRARASKRQ